MKNRYRWFTTIMVCATIPFGIILTSIFIVLGMTVEGGMIAGQCVAIALIIIIMRRGVRVYEED